MTVKERLLFKIKMQGPINRKALLTEMLLHFPELRDRRMRKLVEELIRDGHPISSSEKGYSIIQNVEQLRAAVEYLKAKARAISIRGNTLIGNYDIRYQDAPANLQFKLF